MKNLRAYLFISLLSCVLSLTAISTRAEYPATKLHLSVGGSSKKLLDISKDNLNPFKNTKLFVSGGLGYNVFGPVVIDGEIAYKRACDLDLVNDTQKEIDFGGVYARSSLDVISMLGITSYVSVGIGFGKLLVPKDLQRELGLETKDSFDASYKLGGGLKFGFNNYLELKAGYEYCYLGRYEKILSQGRSDHTFSVGVIIF